MSEFVPGQVAKIPVDRRWAISCYIPFINIVTCLITLVRKVDSKFCLFHARQGVVLFVLWFVTIFIALVSQVISLMLWGVVLALYVAGVVTSYRGAEVKFPLVGQLAMKIPPYYVFTTLTGKLPENSDNNTNNLTQ